MVADITVLNRSGDIVLIVEIKVRTGTDAIWASRIHHDLLAHQTLPHSIQYFLLATPDTFYLWKDMAHKKGIDTPGYIINPSSVLKPYFEKINRAPESLGHDSFEMIVSSWLMEVLIADTPSLLTGYDPGFVESGLIDAIIGGKLGREVPV
jgi:hypothetical protein